MLTHSDSWPCHNSKCVGTVNLYLNQSVGAFGYLEASAKTGAGVHEVMLCCIRAVLSPRDGASESKRKIFTLPWRRCVVIT